jgi:hypothetical protein
MRTKRGRGQNLPPQDFRKVKSEKRKVKLRFITNAQFFSLVSLLTLSKLSSSRYAFESPPIIPPWRVYLKVTKFMFVSHQINTQKGLNKIVTLVLAHIVFVLSYHVSG